MFGYWSIREEAGKLEHMVIVDMGYTGFSYPIHEEAEVT